MFASAAPADISTFTGSSRFVITDQLLANVPGGAFRQTSGSFNFDLANALINDLVFRID